MVLCCSSRRQHTSSELVIGVQLGAVAIYAFASMVYSVYAVKPGLGGVVVLGGVLWGFG